MRFRIADFETELRLSLGAAAPAVPLDLDAPTPYRRALATMLADISTQRVGSRENDHIWGWSSTSAPYDPAFTRIVVRCGRRVLAVLTIPPAPPPTPADNAAAPIP